uniref:MCM C-terminal AAA(+) ATPase domain-containing protein n=1 Tax=Craspedostauros australis TaxID=1486917 RepID=A0A7R9WPW9_9STRA
MAAANPLYSRYNRKKSLSENINLPNSLLSRFDLMFLILDVADMDKDIALARHVTSVHRSEATRVKKLQNGGGDDDDNGGGGNDGNNNDDDDDNAMRVDDDEENGESANGTRTTATVPPKVLREYIARARKHEPFVPLDVAPYIVEAYVTLRMEDRPSSRKGKRAGDQTVMTARQLLSILRLSQALARLRFSDFIAKEDVDEAIRLTHMSKATLLEEERKRSRRYGRNNGDGDGEQGDDDDMNATILGHLRDYAQSLGVQSLDLMLCTSMVVRKGFTSAQLEECLQKYERVNVLQVNEARTEMFFVN